MYKAIFIDIDGTLRNSNEVITKRTVDSIKNITEKGIFVVLCSGRSRKFTENISRESNASKYIITSNGADIYDYVEKRAIYSNIMSKSAIIQLYEISEKNNLRFIMNVGDNRVFNNLAPYDNPEEKLKIPINEFLENNDVVQCLLTDKNFEKIKEILPYIEKIKSVAIKNQHKALINPEAPKIGSAFCDIANEDSSKGNAIIKLCEFLNIDLNDAVAIGDDFNDVTMFNVVGHSVAMGNANDEVKKYADEITKSNEEDGVAIFLEKLLAEIEK